MSERASGAASPGLTGTISIGEVLQLLKREYPDVTISKIRFLEAEGLIAPERTASGYRRFSQGDVERLRSVLSMQRDQYLPLKVIREALDSDEAASAATAPVSAVGSGMRPEDFRPGAGRVRMTRGELAEAAGLDESYLGQLEGIGVLWASPAGHYDEDALAITQVISRLSAFGIEPRHLRSFRVVTDRETGVIEQMATPFSQPRDRDGRARQQETVRELASLFVQLHAALLRADLIRGGRA